MDSPITSSDGLADDLASLRFHALSIRTAADETVEATVLDGNAHGMAVVVPAAHAPLEPGGTVELRLAVAQDVLALEARVRSHARVDGVDRYGLELERPLPIGTATDAPDVRPLFVRRSATRARIEPEEAAPARVIAESCGADLPGRVANVSVDGLCVELALEDARALEGVEHFDVELRLPGETAWLGLPATVRGRFTSGPRAFLALEITRETRRRLHFTLERIEAFVARRRRARRRAG